jgi:ribose 1,5-bisphosphokinase
MAGTFVCVVGPSGAGKDTMIRGVQAALSADGRFTFPRRVVTREATETEAHDTVSAERFRHLEAEGSFALSWSAHGLHYAIPGAVAADVREGRVAVCNLSRRAVADARARFGNVRVVLVTAPRAVLRARILARGRENEGEVDRRLDREAGGRVEADLAIENVGPPEANVARFAAFLGALAGRRGVEAASSRLFLP